jgi:hypothetical protein
MGGVAKVGGETKTEEPELPAPPVEGVTDAQDAEFNSLLDSLTDPAEGGTEPPASVFPEPGLDGFVVPGDAPSAVPGDVVFPGGAPAGTDDDIVPASPPASSPAMSKASMRVPVPKGPGACMQKSVSSVIVPPP